MTGIKINNYSKKVNRRKWLIIDVFAAKAFSYFINSFQQSFAYLISSAPMCSNESEEGFIIGDGALDEKELSNNGDSELINAIEMPKTFSTIRRARGIR